MRRILSCRRAATRASPSMHISLLTASFCLLFVVSARQALAQDSSSLTERLQHFPNKFFRKIQGKADDLSRQLDRQTQNYLRSLSRQDRTLRRKLSQADSAGTKNFLANDNGQRYDLMLQKMRNDTSTAPRPASGAYYPYMDSMKTSLAFLNKHPQLLDASKVDPAQIQTTLNKLQVLQNKMQDADQIKQLVQQRQDEIKACLSKYAQLPSGMLGAYNGYNQRYFYYTQQVQQYKDMLNDPDKMTTTALGLLNKVPAYTNFLSKNSMLAGALNLPAGTTATTSAVQGLATRDQVMEAFNSQFGKQGPDMTAIIQGKVQDGQGSAAQLTDKLTSLGNSQGADIDIPDFKPNMQKTKSFLKRLVYGVDLQTIQGSYFFPATSDIGVSVAYKLNDDNSLGVGVSAKVGWGQDISHIRISGQGLGLRSFADFRIKKSWFATGGFEYNYQQPFQPPDAFHLRGWTPSGLVGISKVISMKTKFFKSTKVQFLWDFLSYEQVPKTAAFKFRIGYSF
jgi:hypothetical protein